MASRINRAIELLQQDQAIYPKGELLLGIKLESPEGVANCEEILAVPGLGFAEMGPADLGLSLGYTTLRRDPDPPEMQEAHDRIFATCRKIGIAFLEGCSPANIIARLDEGVRVIAGGNREMAMIGRAHQKRAMPVSYRNQLPTYPRRVAYSVGRRAIAGPAYYTSTGGPGSSGCVPASMSR